MRKLIRTKIRNYKNRVKLYKLKRTVTCTLLMYKELKEKNDLEDLEVMIGMYKDAIIKYKDFKLKINSHKI